MDETSRDDDGQLCWARACLASESPVLQVPVASVVRGDSPRPNGESKAHAQSMVDGADMPPIIAHLICNVRGGALDCYRRGLSGCERCERPSGTVLSATVPPSP